MIKLEYQTEDSKEPRVHTLECKDNPNIKITVDGFQLFEANNTPLKSIHITFTSEKE